MCSCTKGDVTAPPMHVTLVAVSVNVSPSKYAPEYGQTQFKTLPASHVRVLPCSETLQVVAFIKTRNGKTFCSLLMNILCFSLTPLLKVNVLTHDH